MNSFVPKPWHPQVALDRVDVGKDAGKLAAEVLGLGGEGRDGAEADDAVRVAAEDVVVRGVEVRGLDQADREVVTKVSPDSQPPHPGHQPRPPAASVAGLHVPQPPGQVHQP